MKLQKCIISLWVIAAIILGSCKTNKKQESDVIDYNNINLNESKNVISSFDTIGEGLPIFYNMYLSVEMTSLFESVKATFNQDLLNRTEKATDYITSSKKALNLGVYAVDLSYARIFDQLEIAGRYFNSMQKLSEELGIPGDFFLSTAKRFERNINDKDSLIKIANEVYVTTDSYLKENEQYAAAAQIILGGWIEAIYIASNVAMETKDINIIERFIDQKYSLKNLLDMLSNFNKNEIVHHYIVMLKNIDVKFRTLKLEVSANPDPNSPEVKQAIALSLKQIGVINKQITALRKEIVE